MATQCIAAAQGAGASNRNDASQTQLINHCKAVAEQISALVQSVRASMANPDSPSAQLGLINSSQAMIPVSGVMRGCVGVNVWVWVWVWVGVILYAVQVGPVIALCLPDITAFDQIFQAFSLHICILQVIKDWRWEWPVNLS